MNATVSITAQHRCFSCIASCILATLFLTNGASSPAESPAAVPSDTVSPETVSTRADDGSASQWQRFHGPDGLGRTSGGHLPDSWTEKDYDWTLSLRGTDVGSPVANDSMVFLLDSTRTEQDGEEKNTGGTVDLIAVDLASGKELWRRSHPVAATPRHTRNSPASTTPALDGDRVFFAYGDAKGAYLYAYSLSGERLWHRPLGPWTGIHGFGTSPVVIDSRLVLFNSQQVDELESWQVAGESRMMTFDLATGETLWSTPVKATRPCYGVPAVYPSDADPNASASPTQLIAANKGDGLFGLDLKTGKMIWSLDVFDKRCCSSPLVIGDIAIGTCGSGGGGNFLSAVRIPKQPGESAKEVFRITSGAPYVPTPAVKDGLLFAVSDAGIASCFDAENEGRKMWSQRIGGNFSASPIIIGDRLLMVSLDGTAHVTDASDRRSPISGFELGGKAGATPAYASGRLILRAGSKLHCLPLHGG